MTFSPGRWFTGKQCISDSFQRTPIKVFSFYFNTASICYLASFILDLFDGMAARKFDQCSEFGGLLDMVTDRCSTLGLLFVLYGEYGSESSDKEGQICRLVSDHKIFKVQLFCSVDLPIKLVIAYEIAFHDACYFRHIFTLVSDVCCFISATSPQVHRGECK